jgi:hypothetical protein
VEISREEKFDYPHHAATMYLKSSCQPRSGM